MGTGLAVTGTQRCGSSSSSRLTGCSAMRPRTSRNQANGSMPAQFTRSNEAAEIRRDPAAVVAAEENPVVTTHCKAPQRSLGTVVVDQQIAVETVSRQRRSVLQRIGNG